MKINLKNIILDIFLISTFLDAFITVLIKVNFKVFNETNPIYLFTNSLTLLIITKFIMIFLLFMYFYKPRYYFFPKLNLIRYGFCVMLVLITIGQFNGFLSGIEYYNTPQEEIKPISKEIRREHYFQTNYPSVTVKKENPIASFAGFYLLVLLTFFVWDIMETFNKIEAKNEHLL